SSAGGAFALQLADSALALLKCWRAHIYIIFLAVRSHAHVDVFDVKIPPLLGHARPSHQKAIYSHVDGASGTSPRFCSRYSNASNDTSSAEAISSAVMLRHIWRSSIDGMSRSAANQLASCSCCF